MEGGDGRAFGRVAADHAVPVLVAAAPPRAARVGEIRGHARFVAQLGVPGELGAVVMRHSGAGGGRQPGEHGLLRRHARGGGLVGHDRGHEETGAPLDLGVQAAARADDAVGPPLPPGLVGVYPPADGLRAAAHHGAAGMLHGEAPAHQRRRPAPARSLRDPRPQAARRQAPRSMRNRLAAHGPAARGPGHVAAARPEPPGPARPARFALAGREPRVASDLPAGRGRMPSRHHGHAAHARPVAHLNPDDLPFLFRQARIHLAQSATPLRLVIRTISNLTGAALSIRQRASHHAVIILL